MRRAEQGFTPLTHKKVRILFRIKPTEHVFLTLLMSIRPSNQPRGMQSKLKNTLKTRYYRSETSSNNVSQPNLNWPGENATGISTVP